MYDDEFSLSYSFKAEAYSSEPVSWITYSSSDHTFVVTPTQAAFDLYTGTTPETY